MTIKDKIVAALRKQWLWYGENRKWAFILARVKGGYQCATCKTVIPVQKLCKIDHIENLTFKFNEGWDWNVYLDRLFNGSCELLCKDCHDLKTKHERRYKKLDNLKEVASMLLPILDEIAREWLISEYQAYQIDIPHEVALTEEVRKEYLTRKNSLRKGKF